MYRIYNFEESEDEKGEMEMKIRIYWLLVLALGAMLALPSCDDAGEDEPTDAPGGYYSEESKE